MSNLQTRRGLLALTGTGAAASLAGCSQLESITGGADADDALTVTVQPDREQLSALEEELRAGLESGDISQQEAQQRFSETQRRLTEEAAATFEETAANSGELSIVESAPSYGFFLVDASGAAIVDALRRGEIAAIYPRAQFEQFAQQRDRLEQQRSAMRSQQGGNGTTNGGNETATDGNESTANESDTGTDSGT
ncbi:hypothetical protein [Natrinema marinum]|uniref:hypothetical protein n=1 Tax=Natrinema marinum TaxID=2961598 RepID=UPI0020C8492B|nr:hypothetical protein [Natrinema marinum]